MTGGNAQSRSDIWLSHAGTSHRLSHHVRSPGATAVDVALMPWVFTQRHPLDTSSFIDEAKKRGIELDLSTLRELYRYGLLAPFVELTYRPVRAPFKPDEPEPMAGSSRLMEIREARDTGCLRDLSAEPFKPHLPFERGRQKSRFWWNGL